MPLHNLDGFSIISYRKGRITADAMHCQRETCRRVVQKKGSYLFGLKENQPSLLEDVRLFFEGGIKEAPSGKAAKQQRKMQGA